MSNRMNRRRILRSTGALALGGTIAGCLGNGDSDDDPDGTPPDDGNGDENGDGNGDGNGAQTYTVGHDEYEQEVSSADFPDELFIYAVQTGWSNWDAVMAAFEDEYGVPLRDDQRTSGEALSNIRANAGSPTHSAYNGFYPVGLEVWQDGFTTDYKPAGWDRVPDEFKTDDGHVTATRQMTVAINYRRDIYEERGLDEPESWEDLKHPDIAQDLALNVPGAGAGLNAMLSINHAYGGDLDNLDPLFDYLEDIAEHGAEHRRNLDRQFTGGEISTYAEFDFGGLSTKYLGDDIAEEDVGVMIPTGPDGGEGAVAAPYGYALLDGAPNPEAAKLFMDFVLSLDVQQLFFDGFVRPIRADELDAPDEFPPQEMYEAASFEIDQLELLEKQQDIVAEIINRSPLPGVEA